MLSSELIARVGSAHPMPVADAVAGLAAAESLHERRDRVVEAFRAQLRCAAAVALGVRAQFGPGPADEPKQLVQALRGLRSRGLTDGQWVGMLRGLMASWQQQADAYPVPGFAQLFAGKAGKQLAKVLDGLLEMRKAETVAHGATGSAQAIQEVLERREPQLAALLERFDPIWDEARLVVPLAPDDDGQSARLLMGYAPGAGRFRRIRLDTDEPLPPDEPVLVGRSGEPLVSLHPIASFRRPSPDATEELFLLDGARKNAAVYVALPSMAEHRERGVWDRLGPSLFGEDEPDAAPPSSGGISRPYRGLASFSAAEAALFFGREEQAEALANRIRRHPMVTVTGSSGSGKSSLLFAGVLPLLEDADVRTMRPGADPLSELRRVTFDEGDRLKVLVVDQAEELFTLCHDEARRRAFADALVAMADGRVVLSLREDFFARLATLPALRGVYTRQVEVVTTPDEHDLMRILVQPAELFGFRFEEAALVEGMVEQVRGEPAALAMLQFCADQLWERRDRAWKRLTWDAYRALGGVEGALAAHAEATLAEMTTAQQAAVRAAFLRLVTEEGTRATVPKAELESALGARGDSVVGALLDARLLTAREIELEGEPEVVVEVVHEALLGHWDRLEGWIEEDEEFIRVRARVAQAAARWDAEGRLGEMLLGEGKPLLEATEIHERRGEELSETERAFVVASQARARRLQRL
ncbi:MAG: hypothetical protein JRI23_31960, partial [Deltaproteobacteria bacterium]|nr:hypothetical protein [Deltaproteobacteria bacterium]MBW2536840.1 hypothetical protein [Deltaproteobacteria bacterium]